MPNHLCFAVEKNGKTIHLLKSGSKATQSAKPRKKVELLGSFDQYTESKKKPQPPAHVAAPNQIPSQNSGAPSILQMMAPGPKENVQAPKGKDAKMSNK